MAMSRNPTKSLSGQLIVNDEPLVVSTCANASLLDVLREDHNLTGAKRGCDIGTCGTCTVLVDGIARKSCSFPATQALDTAAQVTTIEHFGGSEASHPLQQAFIDHGAVQCGYCTPGLVLSAAALIERKPRPTRADVARIFRTQLCRCTGYHQIIDAIMDGAGRMRGDPPIRTRETGAPQIGQSRTRGDAIAKVSGHCDYTADQRRPGMLHAVVVRSTRPHATIQAIRTEAALAVSGVLRVLTHEDVPGQAHYGNAIPDMPALAVDCVRFVGDSVCIVIATDAPSATQGAAAIEVDYVDRPLLTDPRKGLEPDAPKLHPAGNIASHQTLRKGRGADAITDGEVVLSGTYQTQAQEHACLETESAIAWIDGPDLIIHAPSQNVYFDRREVARVTGWDKRNVIIRQQPMGAAFGNREDLYCQHHAALASLAMGGVPVKIEMTREETFLCTTKRHPFYMDYTVSASREGDILAIQARIVADTGAYSSWAPNILRKALVHGAGAYDVNNIQIDAYSVYTNNGYAGAFRGFGAPQVFFAIESIVDELAEVLAMDPVELRARNMLRLGSHTATGQHLHASVGLSKCMQAARTGMAWDEGQAPADPSGRYLYGAGYAHAFYGIGYGNGIPDIGSAILELQSNGAVQLRISTVDYGQGSSTVLPQMVCQELGLDLDQIELISGDTSICPDSGSTVASRQTYISGNAVLLACERFTRKLTKAAAKALEIDPAEVTYRSGHIEAGAHTLSLAELAARLPSPCKTQARFRATTSRLDPETGQGDAYWPYAFGAQTARVRVDTQTGRVQVLHMVAAQDVGKALNPQMVEGQIRGAVAMGVGFALLENYRVENGIPLDTNFDTYRLPMHADCPDLDIVIVEEPDPTGPYGAKGVGEPPMVPTAPAIANAVAAAIGERIRSLPITPEKVLEALAKRSQ